MSEERRRGLMAMSSSESAGYAHGDFTVEANKVYEINVYQGYGLAASWEVSA